MQRNAEIDNLVTLDTFTLEKAVVWDAISDSSLIPYIRAIVKPEYFSNEGLREIWNRVVKMADSAEAIDLATALKPAEIHFFADMLGNNSSMLEANAHANTLREGYIRKNAYAYTISLAQKIGSGAEISEIRDNASKMVESIDRNIDTKKGVHTAAESVNRLADELQAESDIRREGKTSYIPTGFPSLDRIFHGGWKPGNSIVLAARPGCGKTSVGLQMARQASLSGFPTIYFSLEMTDTELTTKSMLAEGGLDNQMLYTYNIDWSRFDRAGARLSQCQLFIDDQTTRLEEILSKVRLATQRGIKLVIIDHVGLTESENKSSSYQSMTEKTGKIKRAAMAAKVPIIGLFQLNRDSVKDGQLRAPDVSDLRDSGSIEQDADKILMMCDGFDPNTKTRLEPRVVFLYVRKNRGGILLREPITLVPNETFSQFTEQQTY